MHGTIDDVNSVVWRASGELLCVTIGRTHHTPHVGQHRGVHNGVFLFLCAAQGHDAEANER